MGFIWCIGMLEINMIMANVCTVLSTNLVLSGILYCNNTNVIIISDMVSITDFAPDRQLW